MQATATTTASPADRSTEFVPVQGGSDSTSAGGLLVAAYVVMWALVVGFVVQGWRRQVKIDARIGDLERALAARSNDGTR